MADTRTLGAWSRLDVTELRRELERSDDRRIVARAGSPDHWQAVRDIHVLTAIIGARLTRGSTGAARHLLPSRREAPVVAPTCQIPGCAAAATVAQRAARTLGDLCDLHVLELTSAPDR